MKTLTSLLFFLILVVIITASMMAFKIETFANLSDPNVFPQTPNDASCFNYIKNIKKWNTDELNKEQLRVLYTMRTLQGGQFSSDNKVFPYKDGCVIPKEHYPIFNKELNDDTPLNVYPPNEISKNACTTGTKNNMEPYPMLSSRYTLDNTDINEYPKGLKIDFSKTNYQQFKDILQGSYNLYDSEFLQEKHRLEDEIKRLEGIRDHYKGVLENLVNQTNYWIQEKNKLLDPNSQCQQTKRYFYSVVMPEWNGHISTARNIINQINTLWGYLWEGWIQIWRLYRCW